MFLSLSLSLPPPPPARPVPTTALCTGCCTRGWAVIVLVIGAAGIGGQFAELIYCVGLTAPGGRPCVCAGGGPSGSAKGVLHRAATPAVHRGWGGQVARPNQAGVHEALRRV